mmetsp:Transcript_23459/g.58711  ORF Transcript_23459/g.58711 Transcript_23459/m.58711 type:complete len:263 (+) Transcript_23459:1412-2200(+)
MRPTWRRRRPTHRPRATRRRRRGRRTAGRPRRPRARRTSRPTAPLGQSHTYRPSAPRQSWSTCLRSRLRRRCPRTSWLCTRRRTRSSGATRRSSKAKSLATSAQRLCRTARRWGSTADVDVDGWRAAGVPCVFPAGACPGLGCARAQGRTHIPPRTPTPSPTPTPTHPHPHTTTHTTAARKCTPTHISRHLWQSPTHACVHAASKRPHAAAVGAHSAGKTPIHTTTSCYIEHKKVGAPCFTAGSFAHAKLYGLFRDFHIKYC